MDYQSMQYAAIPRRIGDERIAETFRYRQGISTHYVISHWLNVESSATFRPGSFKNVDEGTGSGTRLIEELYVCNVRE
tara:strand:+ start:340 stop:573 length:234 start_codon:yes stop_codon:yes gene_type:complete